MVLLCGASAVSAAHDNAVDNLTSDMDDSFLVSNNLNAVGVDESASVAQENDDGLLGQSLNVDNVIDVNSENDVYNLNNFGENNVLSSENEDSLVVYVGHNNKTETGDGSKENPFSSIKNACDYVNGNEIKDAVTINIFNGTYYLGSHLKFNTNNLYVNGFNGTVTITNLYDITLNDDGDYSEAFGLTSNLANFTLSNIIFDGSSRTSNPTFEEADPEWPDDPFAWGPMKSFFLPFYGNANTGTFINCTFLGGVEDRITGATEYHSKFVKCYFDISNSWKLLFLSGGATVISNNAPYFEYCIFNLEDITRLADGIICLPSDISMNDVWFGQNSIPSYVGPYASGYVANPDGHWNTEWLVPINRYAIFSIHENFLGDDLYEIVGKLTWNGTDNQEGMENFQPMIVRLESDTGEINSTAMLVNGTFKTTYKSLASNHKVTATLHYEKLELNFHNVGITANPVSIYYGNDQNISINFTQPIKANVTLIVSNESYRKTYDVEVNDKEFITYTIQDTLKAGDYDVEIILNSNSYYGVNKTQFQVSKISTYPFEVLIPSESKVGENVTITINLPEDVEGKVIINLGTYSKELSANQTMTIDFNNLNATTYNVNVSYVGSDKYISKEKIDSVTVDKGDSNVKVEDIAFNYGEVISIPFIVNNANGVNVRVLNKNGEEVTNTTSNGVEFTLDILPSGEYTLEVTTIVDEKNYYDFTADNIVLTINKADSSLTLNDSYEFTYSLDAVINVVTQNSTGNVIVSLIGEEEYAVSVSDNEIYLPALNVGKYTLTVTTNPDENHNNVTKTAIITINKAVPSMNVVVKPVENITTKDNVTLTISLPSDATGEVTVKINGKKADSISANETITINLNNQAGDYVVDITYSGDKNYESDMATTEYTVSKAETSITANPIIFEEGNTSTIEINIPDVDSGFILVDVEGKKFYGDINSGKATVLIDGLVAGNYTANIIFVGDEKFNKATGTVAVNVTPTVDIISQLNEIIKELNNTIEAQKEQINSLNDTVISQNSTIESQTEKINNLTDVVAAQNNTIESQKAAIESLNNTVISQNSTIESQTKEISNLTDTVVAQNSTIESQTKEINNLNTTVNDQSSTIESQKEQIGNLNKQIDKKDVVLVVDQAFTRVAVDYNAGERGGMFYAILKDSEGKALANKTVQIAFNGKVYNRTTDNEGKAGIQINLANANTYSYAVSFQGDDQYNAAPIAVSKLTVTKKKTTIKAANKVFKAKTKTKKISITLKTVKNQYDKKTYLKSGKKVTLKVNGKTYTAKINKKGVAKFTIKITKKGKYTAKIKFAGDKTYKASSKSIKIRIK